MLPNFSDKIRLRFITLNINLQLLPTCHRVQGCQGYQSYPTEQRSEVRGRPVQWLIDISDNYMIDS